MGLLLKLWRIFSSPLGHIATPILEKGGEMAGKKIEKKMDDFFGFGEKGLGDEIACDDVVAELDNEPQELFEEFMGWLEEQPNNGHQKAEIIRKIIFAKIKTKKITVKDGKKKSTSYSEPDYSCSINFIKRILAQGDHGAMLRYLQKKNFFSVISAKKTPLREQAKKTGEKIAKNKTMKKVVDVVKVETADGKKSLTSMLDDLASWLDSQAK